MHKPKTIINTRRYIMVIGYTAGVYDLCHIGHLNLLKNAKGMCDKLVVGVTTDDLVEYKGKRSLIPFEERIEIVRSIKYVDSAIPQYDMDKLAVCKKIGATIMFVGDDWYNTDKWNKYVPEQYRDFSIKLLHDMGKYMNTYFRKQALISIIVGTLFAIAFSIMGLGMSIGLGLLIAVLHMIPYMHTLGIIPALFVALVQSAQYGDSFGLYVLYIVLAFGIIQVIVDAVLVNYYLPEKLADNYVKQVSYPVQLDVNEVKKLGVKIFAKKLIQDSKEGLVRHSSYRVARAVYYWFKREQKKSSGFFK